MNSNYLMKLECISSNTASSTGSLNACRACLSTECKLIDLHSNNLAEQLSELTGTAVHLDDGLPQQLCTYCCALLRKGTAFRKSCRTAFNILLTTCSQGFPVTQDCIRNVATLHLRSTFAKTDTFNIDFLCTKRDSYDESYDDVKIIIDASENLNTYKSVNIKPEPDLSKHLYNDNISIPTTDPLSKLQVNNADVKSKPDLSISFQAGFDSDSDTSIDRFLSDIKCEKEKSDKSEFDLTNLTKYSDVEFDNEIDNSIEGRISDVNFGSKSNKKLVKRKKHNKQFEKQYNVAIMYLCEEEQIREFEARREMSSYTEATYKCDHCYKGFMREVAYNNHMQVHDPSGGQYQCTLCRMFFDQVRSYNKHMYRHKQRLKCNDCSFISKSTTQAKLHFNLHKGAKFECKECGKVCNKYSSYMLHLRKAHGSAFCSICSEPFLGEQGLRAHMMKAHRKAVEYRCSACGVQFLSDSALHRHVAAAPTSGCKDIKACEHCGINLPTEDMLVDHLQHEHDVRLRCDECGVTFKNVLLCKKHRYKIHGEGGAGRPLGSQNRGAGAGERRDHKFMCEMCGGHFKNKAVLKVHQRTHTGEKPFQCMVCYKQYKSKYILKMHMNTHTGEKPFKCKHCTKAFSLPSNRDRHVVQVHNKERPYECHICGKAYTSRDGQKMHIRTAHMKEPWPKRVRRKQNC